MAKQPKQNTVTDDQSAAESAVTETLSPSELAGGVVHLAKAPKEAIQVGIGVRVGDEIFGFPFQLEGAK